MGGVLREQVSTVEIAAGDDNNSVFRMARVHSSWRISQLTVFCDAVTCGTSFSLGLYRTAEDGGAVVNVNCYADAAALTSASLVGTEMLFEAGSDKAVEHLVQSVWQDAGLTADPGVWYDIAFIGLAVGTSASTISLRTRYVANS